MQWPRRVGGSGSRISSGISGARGWREWGVRGTSGEYRSVADSSAGLGQKRLRPGSQVEMATFKKGEGHDPPRSVFRGEGCPTEPDEPRVPSGNRDPPIDPIRSAFDADEVNALCQIGKREGGSAFHDPLRQQPTLEV